MQEWGPALGRRLGDIDCARALDPGVDGAGRPPLVWKRLPEDRDDGGDIYAEVRLPSDYTQPPPLRLQLLFEPDPPGVYDIQWLVPTGTRLAVGEPAARAYRAADGLAYTQVAGFPMVVREHLVERNQRAVPGDALLGVQVPSLAVDMAPVRELVDEMRMELAQAVNAMVKGYMASIGQSGQVAKSALPIQVALRPEEGYEALLAQIVAALHGAEPADGDVLVTSEKIFAIAQGRVFPLHLLQEHDPKTTDRQGRADLAERVAAIVPDVTPADLLLADSLADWSAGPSATAGVADPNRVAHELARHIRSELGVTVDVVVSDTDTGLDVREQLVNCITIGATPLGATAGLVMYECMRVANAAEFVRGSSRGIPLVLCKPHPRRRRREGLGEHRGYAGRLDAKRERLLGYA